MASAAIIPGNDAAKVDPSSIRVFAQGDTFLALLASFLSPDSAAANPQQSCSTVSVCDQTVEDGRDKCGESKSKKTKHDGDDENSEAPPTDDSQLSGSAVNANAVVPANLEFIVVAPSAKIKLVDDDVVRPGAGKAGPRLETAVNDVSGCFGTRDTQPANQPTSPLPATAPLAGAAVPAASSSDREEHRKQIAAPAANRSEKSAPVSKIELTAPKNANDVESGEFARVLDVATPAKQFSEDIQSPAADVRVVTHTAANNVTRATQPSSIDPMVGREAHGGPQVPQPVTQASSPSNDMQLATKKSIPPPDACVDGTVARPEVKQSDGPSVPAATHSGSVLDSVRREPSSGPVSTPSRHAVTSRPEADPASLTPSPVTSRELRALHETEVRIAWRSEQLGRVDIQAEIKGRNVSAALRVENEGARQFLTSEMPRMADALRGHEFTVNTLQVASFGSNSSPSDGGAHQDRGQAPRSPMEREEQRSHAECTPQDLSVTTTHRVSIHV